MRSRALSVALRYGCAVAAVAVAAAVRRLLDPVLVDQYPFLTFLPAILLAAWVGGSGPALVALGLGGLAANYLFMEPRGTVAVHGWDQQVGLGVYLLVGL